MKLTVFTGNEDLYRIGEITILYDRVVHVDFNLKNYTPRQILDQPTQAKRTKTSIIKKASYPFSIKKLSKADIPYRDYKLTHVIYCDDLNKMGLCQTYIRLTAVQYLRIMFNTKNFFWQTHEFKKSIHRSIGNHIVLGLVGIVGTIALVVAPWKNKNNPGNKPPVEQGTLDSLERNSRAPDSLGYTNKENTLKE